MPRRKKMDIDSKIQEKLDFIGLDFNKISKNLQEYTEINFRTLKGYDEKKYKQYRFVNVKDIEILLSPTNRIDSIKDKYEKANPLCYYLDSQNEERLPEFTKFLEMMNKVSIKHIEAIDKEQKKLAKALPFKIKFDGNYLWQIYYSEISEKYFMIVPTEDSDYSTFFYLLKKKIENKPTDKIFVPISLVDYEEKVLKKDEIKDLENYLWLFTKDYPLIYEVTNKKKETSMCIIGETEIYDKIKTLYKINLNNAKDAMKFYKLTKALFILQTELPHYYNFSTNIDEEGSLNYLFNGVQIKYETLLEFITEQYLKSVSLKNKALEDLEKYKYKLNKLQNEADILENEYVLKEKQITTYLECKKTFFGKMKYFFKYGKKTKNTEKSNIEEEVVFEEEKNEHEKYKLEEKKYTLYELEKSYKDLEKKENEIKKMVLDINALKLKIKNLKKKIENASKYIDEINKHKRSIFEFWKYANKDTVASLDEGEEEEFNVKKIEKVFNYDSEFEKFGYDTDKFQRLKFTDDELNSSFIFTTDLIDLLNKINLGNAENKEISEKLKEIKIEKENVDIEDFEEDNMDDIFSKISFGFNKERTMGNRTHREQPRNKFDILEVKKGSKGIELKRNLEEVLENIKTAIEKNKIKEDMYIYKATSEKLEFNTFETFSLNVEEEVNKFLENDKIKSKVYLYKLKIPKGTNYIAFTNIIYFDNKNMTLPVGMNLSSKILIDLSKLKLEEVQTLDVNKLQFEKDSDDFSKTIIKNIEIKEFKQ